MKFEDVLDRRCNLLSPSSSGYDAMGEPILTYPVAYANVKCRREPSEATDNVRLVIGDGEQLRTQEVFWFLPDQAIDRTMRIELLPRTGDPSIPETTTWEILEVSSLDMIGRVHHKVVEATLVDI